MTDNNEASAEIRKSQRLFIIEDELIFAKAVNKRLTKQGYQCVACPDLASAEHALKSEQPALMLLDMRLPDGSGLDFLAQVRDDYGTDIPVVIMTAYGEVEDAVTAMKLR